MSRTVCCGVLKGDAPPSELRRRLLIGRITDLRRARNSRSNSSSDFVRPDSTSASASRRSATDRSHHRRPVVGCDASPCPVASEGVDIAGSRNGDENWSLGVYYNTPTCLVQRLISTHSHVSRLPIRVGLVARPVYRDLVAGCPDLRRRTIGRTRMAAGCAGGFCRADHDRRCLRDSALPDRRSRSHCRLVRNRGHHRRGLAAPALETNAAIVGSQSSQVHDA